MVELVLAGHPFGVPLLGDVGSIFPHSAAYAVEFPESFVGTRSFVGMR